MIWFVCLKKSTEKFIKTNCRQLAAGVGWGAESHHIQINKTLEKTYKFNNKHYGQAVY